ncbi:MAG: hypothetical protein UX16_C0004G0030 [Parcubacteria group bacterium GW2011_GWB1_45_7]|nr:MAG: hypothetical protein UX16_C0004G0030 [Parcubacteria group bacterium GW2011_GWB1_45_7]
MRRRVMHVGWLDYLELNERLLQMVMESSFKPDFVAYITRGGDIPGVWISQRMKLPYVVIGAAHWPHGVKAADVTIAYHCLYVTKEPPSGRMLIVDDLTDTGLTGHRVSLQEIPQGILAESLAKSTRQEAVPWNHGSEDRGALAQGCRGTHCGCPRHLR